MTRSSRWGWAMDVVRVTGKRSTCLRRQVGCVLLDSDGFILATGYNGVAAGLPHCNKMVGHIEASGEVPFPGDVQDPVYPHACPAAFAVSGTNLDGCHAIHAEQNALLRCADVRRILTCFVSSSPCVTCVKLLMNTGCRQIYFDEPYAHDQASRELWQRSRGQGAWIHLTPELEGQLPR